jgi:hypothetical protein
MARVLHGRSPPRLAHGFPCGKGREPTRGSAGWGWARRHGSDAHGDVAATDRGASCHASKGNRGRKRRVGRREKEEERRNSTAPTMDQGWRASQLGVEVCPASFRLPSRVHLPRSACPRGSAFRVRLSGPPFGSAFRVRLSGPPAGVHLPGSTCRGQPALAGPPFGSACRGPPAAVHLPGSTCRGPPAAVRLPGSACRGPPAEVRLSGPPAEVRLSGPPAAWESLAPERPWLACQEAPTGPVQAPAPGSGPGKPKCGAALAPPASTPVPS